MKSRCSTLNALRSCPAILASLALLGSNLSRLEAQTAKLLTDINTKFANATAGSLPNNTQSTTRSSSERGFTKVGPIVYFSAATAQNGRELYRSLGTGPTTQRVADIFPGPGSSNPGSLRPVGSKLFFRADDGQKGSELWVFENAAVSLVKDIWPGPNGSGPNDIVALGSKIVFSATDGANGSELWISDGTATGTKLLKDIQPGAGSSAPRDMKVNAAGNRVYFAAAASGTDHELWVTDGTAAGTKLVLDIRPGTATSNPRYFHRLGANMVFQANDGSTGNELWASDGTAGGTKLVLDIRPGTGAGANLLYSIVVGGKLYFQGSDPATGAEPWVSDGTAAGTKRLADNFAGTGAGGFLWPAAKGGKVYFGARASTAGYQIWETDGTPAGTKSVSGVVGNYAFQYLAFAGNNLFFSARGAAGGIELWISDLTITGTKLLKDINTTSAAASSSPQMMTESIPGTIVCSADDGRNGREIWVSNGTGTGTLLVDLNKPGVTPTASSNPNNLVDLFGQLLFTANDGGTGVELWTSDGTAAGTKLLKDIRAGTGSGSPFYFARLGNKFYFRANDGTSGLEVWETDGTAAGTKLLTDIRAGSASSAPNSLRRIGSKLYFAANNGTHGSELWESDGTAAGTKLLADIRPGSASSAPQQFTPLGNTGKFLFRANNGTNGFELWLSDGTSAGTFLVKDISPGSGSSSPNELTAWGAKVYFAANDSATGIELWESDGTSAGTKLVKDIWPGSTSGRPNNSSPGHFAPLGGKLYFAANDGVVGVEVWETDGTPAGTKLFLDIDPVRGGGQQKGSLVNREQASGVSHLTPVGSRRVWLAASRYPNGIEIWRTDGTVAGTKMVTDVYAGNGSSLPQNRGEGYATRFAVSHGRVYFAANDGLRGREVWVGDNGATAQSIGDNCGASWMTATDPVLGQNMQVSGSTTLPNPVHATLLGLALKKPLPLGKGCYTYVDLSVFFVLAVRVGANWNFSLPVANDSALIDATAVLQTWTLPNAALPNAVQTNGVLLTLGR